MESDTPCRCRFCNSHNYRWESRCPVCTRNGGLVPFGLEASTRTESRKQTLSAINSAEENRIWSRMPTVDRVFGTDWRKGVSGINAPSMVVLAGSPGSGKSTLLIEYCASLSKPSLYLASEQDLSSLRNTADRCGLTQEQLDSIHIEQVGTLENVLHMTKAYKPNVVILDSFSDIIDPEGDRHAKSIRSMKNLYKDAYARGYGMVCVVHVNREDEIALARRVDHVVDALMRFDALGADIRKLHCPSKNRFGRAGTPSYFKMEDRGLKPCDAPAEEEIDTPSQKLAT